MKVTCRLQIEQVYESGLRLFLSLQSTKVYLTEPQDNHTSKNAKTLFPLFISTFYDLQEFFNLYINSA